MSPLAMRLEPNHTTPTVVMFTIMMAVGKMRAINRPATSAVSVTSSLAAPNRTAS